MRVRKGADGLGQDCNIIAAAILYFSAILLRDLESPTVRNSFESDQASLLRLI